MAEELSPEYEPLFVEDEPLHLADIVEDELILALPAVAMHPESECTGAQHPSRDGEEESQPAEAKPNPFAVLAKLKREQKD